MKASVVTASMIVILALASWSFFYIKSVPLSPSETTVVVGVWAIVVLFGKWIWMRLRRTRENHERKS